MHATKGFAAALLAGFLALSGCGAGRPDFTIVSGSENESLEPLVQRFCQQRRVRCEMTFKGSLDIGLSLRPGQTLEADAVWPASGVWIDLYDTERRVRDLQSIYQTPVVLGVRMSKARELGWINRPVRMADILRAVDSGRLSFLMTSATQSNSGASAYLAMLAAALGSPDTMTAEQLDDPRVLDVARRMLRGVARSSGSSGWLGQLYRDTAIEGRPYDAMWNYEAVLKETNDALREHNLETLWAVYPVEGSSVADAPLGYVERGQPERTEAFFHDLQAFLTSPEAQAEIARLGRRIPLGRAAPAAAEPQWNFDPSRLVTAITPPDPDVIRRALNLYQEALRRPSLTVLCLDFSGSMEDEGERQLQEGMRFLLTPERASEALVQWGSQDKIFVIPFNDQALDAIAGTAEPADQARMLAAVSARAANGGTDMYACGVRALEVMRDDLNTGRFLPAIVMMTDGRSEGDAAAFLGAWRADGHAVPVFGVTFGDADREQLDRLATETHARVFDGTSSLADAFRSTRGYN
jgi:Ca-activated chloride channel homolog